MNTWGREFSDNLYEINQAEELQQAVAEQGQQLLQADGRWIRRNPYLALGIAAAVGCAIIACMRRDD